MPFNNRALLRFLRYVRFKLSLLVTVWGTFTEASFLFLDYWICSGFDVPGSSLELTHSLILLAVLFF